MKLTISRSGDHAEDPRSMCHKVSVLSLVAARFIGSKSIFVCVGSLLDLGMPTVLLFFGVAMVAEEDVYGLLFGEAQVSPRV